MGIIKMARTYRSLGRLSHILATLARHGFGEWVDRLNLGHYVPGVKKIHDLPEEGPRLSREEALARRVRLSMEELGPTFVKLGQMLSQRPDLLPPVFIKELSHLREHVQPFPFEEVRRIVEQELGGKLEEVFKEFEPQPIASGSIAQVHRAVTTDDQKVVVKVKRPGIDKVLTTDIDLMRQLAEIIERRAPELAVLRPTVIVDEFSRGMRQELDFISEGSLAQRFGAGFDESDKVLVPGVFWEYTTTSVLTLDRMEGLSLSSMEALDRAGVDRKELAVHVANVFTKQYLETGVFHGDPHSGNLFYCEGGVLGILDFGLMGRLSEEMKEMLGMLLVAVVQSDADVVADVFVDLGAFGEVERPVDLRDDMRTILERNYGLPIKLIDMRKLFLEMMEVARKHHATLPRELVLFGRSFTSVEALARELDPEFDLREVVEPYARKLLLDKFRPERIIERSRRAAWSVSRLLRTGPKKFSELVNRLLAGKLGFAFEHRGLEPLTHEIERASNRMAAAIITAALIVGSSLVLVAKVGPQYGNFPLLGLFGYSTAAIIGFWLLLGILRHGKR